MCGRNASFGLCLRAAGFVACSFGSCAVASLPVVRTSWSCVTSLRAFVQVRRKQRTPLFLPAYVFEYRYLGLPYRALVRVPATQGVCVW